MNFVEAFHEFFAPMFQPLHSWARWLVLAKAAYGLPLDKDELDVFKSHTGRSHVRPGGYPEIVVETGRQSGKTRFCSAIVSFEALRAKREPGHPALYALLVAQDLRAVSRTSFAYIAEMFEAIPELKDSVPDGGRKAESLELENGVIAACYPCRPQATRGIRSSVVCLDELAFFRSSEGYPTDVEMLRAVRPSLATTGGKLFVTSSPYGQSGALWELHQKHFGQNDSPTLIWQATAPQMNPTLPKDYLERMEKEDPEAYRSEVLGEFRAGVSSLLDPDAVAACVVEGRRELPPAAGTRYRAFVDPSGGRNDSFTLGICHFPHGSQGTLVVDCIRAWDAPFDPSIVVAEAVKDLDSYRCRTVVGDRYGGEWPVEAFRKYGIRYEPSPKSKSELYLALVPRINSQTIELPEVPELLRELRGLERRRGSAGKDRVDHVRGAHDDRANVIAGLVGGGGFVREPGDLGISILALVLMGGHLFSSVGVF